jgi:drug/metabolite transporter (DMT)-like permease
MDRMILYIASQVLGSTIALQYLRAEYVAPLGSSSLIFNFVFAYLLVGTQITRQDIFGTLVIVLGVVGVVLFGNNRAETEFDTENLTLALLKELWGRKQWIIYFILGEIITLVYSTPLLRVKMG